MLNRQPCYRFGFAIAALAAVGGCSRDEPEPESVATPQPGVRVVFPPSVEVDDATINDFVRKTIEICASADYERFRALWGATEEPFTREQFERGWQTARRIEVHALQPMRHPKDGSILYYIHASVELAPQMREPKREVVLLIVKRDGRWRLARAPDSVRKRVLKKKTTGSDTQAAAGTDSSNI